MQATDDPDIFNAVSDSVFIGQVKSCREGVNLSSADHLIFLGIDYSALSYLQGRERASFLGRRGRIKFIIFLRKRESSQSLSGSTIKGKLIRSSIIEMTEAQYQKKLIDSHEKEGWTVIKLIMCNKAGLLDLIHETR